MEEESFKKYLELKNSYASNEIKLDTLMKEIKSLITIDFEIGLYFIGDILYFFEKIFSNHSEAIFLCWKFNFQK